MACTDDIRCLVIVYENRILTSMDSERVQHGFGAVFSSLESDRDDRTVPWHLSHD